MQIFFLASGIGPDSQTFIEQHKYMRSKNRVWFIQLLEYEKIFKILVFLHSTLRFLLYWSLIQKFLNQHFAFEFFS